MMMNPRPLPSADQDEFFVGYLPRAPGRTARAVRHVVLIILMAGVLTAAALAAAVRKPAAAVWEDRVSEFTGVLIEHPYAMLRLVDDQGNGVRRALLVATGKHGAAERVAGRDGASVRVRGTALRRDGRLIIELADGDEAVAGSSAVALPTPAIRPFGSQTVVGEIIDPKCFFGAMKPGEGKLHRACAVRCIDGGIPPMLAARNADGRITYYLLERSAAVSGADPADASRPGQPANRRVLPFVAEAVAVTGLVYEVDGTKVIRLDDRPDAIVRR